MTVVYSGRLTGRSRKGVLAPNEELSPTPAPSIDAARKVPYFGRLGGDYDVMTAVETLKACSAEAYKKLLASLDGVSDGLAWAPIPHGPDALYTNGTILGIVRHVAACEIMYASAGFRGLEVRWRDCADRLERIGDGIEANIAYLREAHDYWMASWADLPDAELSRLRKANWGEDLPTWNLIHLMIWHDGYHGGQIAVLRAALSPVTTPPPSEAADIREYLKDNPSY